MKKLLLFLFCSFCLWACTNVYEYTFSVEGETISMMLNSKKEMTVKENTDGFSLESEIGSIQGMFIQTSMYEQYYNTVVQDESATILYRDDDKLIWQVEGESGMECDCLIRVSMKTSVLMGSLDQAKDIYQNVSFEIK